MDLSNIEKSEIAAIRIAKLEASKYMLDGLLEEYLSADPGYPFQLINDQISDIDNQIQALTNMLEML